MFAQIGGRNVTHAHFRSNYYGKRIEKNYHILELLESLNLNADSSDWHRWKIRNRLAIYYNATFLAICYRIQLFRSMYFKVRSFRALDILRDVIWRRYVLWYTRIILTRPYALQFPGMVKEIVFCFVAVWASWVCQHGRASGQTDLPLANSGHGVAVQQSLKRFKAYIMQQVKVWTAGNRADRFQRHLMTEKQINNLRSLFATVPSGENANSTAYNVYDGGNFAFMHDDRDMWFLRKIRRYGRMQHIPCL